MSGLVESASRTGTWDGDAATRTVAIFHQHVDVISRAGRVPLDGSNLDGPAIQPLLARLIGAKSSATVQ